MTPLETKESLNAKLRELNTRQIRREEIAIEKTADGLDEIQQIANRTLALDSLTRNWETAGLISEALERVEAGTYNICDECNEQISPKRLAAIPWAKYCIHCQEAIDRANEAMRWDEAA